MAQEYIPYVSPEKSLPEVTIKAILIGVILVVIVTAANAYIALKVGMTVAACFPAAVMAMALLKPLKGGILEENLSRTMASAGECLVAGAAFVIPAFIYLGIWDTFDIPVTTIICMLGGILGVLFVIMLRSMFVTDLTLPFPESFAASEIVKSGQKGAMGAKYVLFGGLFGAFVEWLVSGFQWVASSVAHKFSIGISGIKTMAGKVIIPKHEGLLYLETPVVGAAYFGIGYIIGPTLAALMFAGGVLGWFAIYPLSMYLSPTIAEATSFEAAYYYVRQIGAGAMIVAAVYTIFQVRGMMVKGVKKGIKALTAAGKAVAAKVVRSEKDISYGLTFCLILLIAIPIGVLYWWLTGAIGGAILATIIMLICGFIFAIIGGHIASLVGTSNNPISGMAIATIVIASLLMVIIGLSGPLGSEIARAGMMAAIGVGGVVCCAAAIGADIIQDLKIGHILGGTPWRMELGEIIGVIVAAPVIPLIFNALLKSARMAGQDLGGTYLPAPQSGVMAILTQGIVTLEAAWPLILVGAIIGIAFILLGIRSPMLVAIGIYLGIPTTFAVFLGGACRWIVDKVLKKRKLSEEQMGVATRYGILTASGMIAGGPIMGIICAFLVIGGVILPAGAPGFPAAWPAHLAIWPALAIFAIIMFFLIYLPIRRKGYETKT
jgi:putative OPT family oligopeptide transporter